MIGIGTDVRYVPPLYRVVYVPLDQNQKTRSKRDSMLAWALFGAFVLAVVLRGRR